MKEFSIGNPNSQTDGWSFDSTTAEQNQPESFRLSVDRHNQFDRTYIDPLHHFYNRTFCFHCHSYRSIGSHNMSSNRIGIRFVMM